jgi:predicted hydrocarbon binding protein
MGTNPILAELVYDGVSGALLYQEVRYLLIRPETLIAFQKEAEARLGIEAAGELLYAGGFSGGRLSGQHYREAHNLSAAEAVAFMCRMGSQIGWGRFDLIEFDEPARRLRVDVYRSPFASAYGSGSTSGVCHLIRGVLGGLVGGLFGAEIRAVETECTARGDPACRFEVRVRE